MQLLVSEFHILIKLIHDQTNRVFNFLDLENVLVHFNMCAYLQNIAIREGADHNLVQVPTYLISFNILKTL